MTSQRETGADMPLSSIAKTMELGDPYIAAGDRAYVVGTQDGDFPDLGWHTPGEMGGVWAHPIKLLDGWWLRVDDTWLDGARRFVAGAHWGAHEYDLPDGLRVERREFAPDGEPAVVVRYTFRSPVSRTLALRLLARTDLQGVWLSDPGGYHDGYDHAVYDDALGAWACRDDCNPWRVVVGARAPDPVGHDSGRDLWGPHETAGRGVSVALDYTLEAPAGVDVELEVVIAGSHTGLAPALACFQRVRATAPALWDLKAARYADLLGRSKLDIPEPSIVRAWNWIKCDYDWLVREVAPWGRGLGAGAADYVWWFGCDAAYALRGCLALGQHDVAVDTLDLLRRLSLVTNGENGRVVHECNTWGYASNPGNTQETPHFARAVWDTFLWTGDLAFLRRNYAFCRRGVLEWTLGERCPDGDVLPQGYGLIEVEGLNQRCVDTAALTVAALDALDGMAEVLGEGGVAARCRALHAAVRRRLEEAFWLEDEGLYADMVATPAEMEPRLRSWIERAEQPDFRGDEHPGTAVALRRLLAEAESDLAPDRARPWFLGHWSVIAPLEDGLAERGRALRTLERAAGPEFIGRWGMYLNALDRGAAMSISTGALAVAEMSYGQVERALERVRLMTGTLDLRMPGAISEMSPDDGCFVQAWSGYGVAWPVVAGVFGLRPDAFRRRLALRPVFPAGWPSARLDNVRVGANSFDLSWDGATLTVTSREPGWSVTCDGAPLRVEIA